MPRSGFYDTTTVQFKQTRTYRFQTHGKIGTPSMLIILYTSYARATEETCTADVSLLLPILHLENKYLCTFLLTLKTCNCFHHPLGGQSYS